MNISQSSSLSADDPDAAFPAHTEPSVVTSAAPKSPART